MAILVLAFTLPKTLACCVVAKTLHRPTLASIAEAMVRMSTRIHRLGSRDQIWCAGLIQHEKENCGAPCMGMPSCGGGQNPWNVWLKLCVKGEVWFVPAAAESMGRFSSTMSCVSCIDATYNMVQKQLGDVDDGGDAPEDVHETLWHHPG